MPSFDVISKINYQEFDNALSNCLREIGNRYDFKGLTITIERKDKNITTVAPDELKLKQVNELLQTHLVRRKVDPRVIEIKKGDVVYIAGNSKHALQNNGKEVLGFYWVFPTNRFKDVEYISDE